MFIIKELRRRPVSWLLVTGWHASNKRLWLASVLEDVMTRYEKYRTMKALHYTLSDSFLKQDVGSPVQILQVELYKHKFCMSLNSTINERQRCARARWPITVPRLRLGELLSGAPGNLPGIPHMRWGKRVRSTTGLLILTTLALRNKASAMAYW